MPISVAISTPEGRSLYRNKAGAEMRGYNSLEETAKVLSASVSGYYDPKDRERFIGLLAKGPVTNFEVRLKRKDDTPFWV